MTEEYAAARFEDACALLPARLRTAALLLERSRKAEAEELRLRIGRPLSVTLPAAELPLPQTRVIRGDLEQVLDRATEYSRYVAAETLCHGYVTAQGGFRIGVCGTALPQGGRNEGIRDVSSLAIRIPRVREGAAGLPKVELTGERDLYLLNFQGILSYGREEIHVDSGLWVLRILGRELELRAMRAGELRITGVISRLEIL